MIVVAGGPPTPLPPLPDADLVIAADSGLDRLISAGQEADVVIGDLDSVTQTALEAARAGGIEIIEHPADKDASDLELALDLASERGADRIIVALADGGRTDHELANLLVLGAPKRKTPISGWWGPSRITVIRHAEQLAGAVDDVVSLFALGGTAEGVTTMGLAWKLEDATLEPGSSRGLSNRFIAPTARVTVAAGVVLAVQPENG